MKHKKILVTGAAGFIGFHLSKALLDEGCEIVGLDNINDYYNVNLKYARLHELGVNREGAEKWNQEISSLTYPGFCFVRMNLEDRERLPALFEREQFDVVINLAAQAGVRYSLENPMAYVDSNVVGFVNLLEACRHHNVPKLLYASSSSVYGNSVDVPFSTEQRVDNPISLYAATKKSNELMSYTYSHLYGIQTIGLRFFTVYGPWGRPDMAMFLFTDGILNSKPIKVFNNGNLSRDFTYIDDIVEGVKATIIKPSEQMYVVYNIGNSRPVKLLDFIEAIEKETGKKAIREMLPMQPGDVERTWADVDSLVSNYQYKPKISVVEGVRNFVKWYRQHKDLFTN